MGTWGITLFSDDTAADVRDDYRDLLAEGHDGPAATDALLERWKDALDDQDDGPTVWLALAVAQHQLGRLEERVRAAAIAVIDEQRGLERWREAPKLLKRRLAELAKVRDRLTSPQPAAKRVRARFKDSVEWEIGEHVAYATKRRAWVVFRVVGEDAHEGGVSPVVELSNWTGDDPGALDAATLRALPVRRGVLTPKMMCERIRVADPLHATSPYESMLNLMRDLGLGSPLDGPEFVERVTRFLDGPDALPTLTALAESRGISTEPPSRISIRRVARKAELPSKRLRRLTPRAADLPHDTTPHLTTTWAELDVVIATVFALDL
jgi:hypothetical protein